MSNKDYRRQCDWCGRRSKDGVVGRKSEHGKNYESAEWFCSQKCLHEYPYSLKWKRNRGIKAGCSAIVWVFFWGLLSVISFNVGERYGIILGIAFGAFALWGFVYGIKGLNL